MKEFGEKVSVDEKETNQKLKNLLINIVKLLCHEYLKPPFSNHSHPHTHKYYYNIENRRRKKLFIAFYSCFFFKLD